MYTEIERCRRSTLYVRSGDGFLVRKYHDTNTWGDARCPIIDHNGHARCSQNRRVDRMLETANGYRGTDVSKAAPLHLRNALSVLCRSPTTMDNFAIACGIKTSTAWNYACRVVERWPEAHTVTMSLVNSEIRDALRQTDDISGTLHTLMERMSPTLSGCTEVRCLSDRYAHLRLARICVEAERAIKFSDTQ